MPVPSPRAALAAAALLLAAPLLAPALAAQATPAPDRRPTLAVLYFRNGAIGNAADYDALSTGIADLLITDLSVNQAIRVVERDRMEAVVREQDLSQTNRIDDATALRIGRTLAARHMIKGSFVVDRRGTMRLVAHAVNVETSRIEHVESVDGKADDVLALIARLSDRLNRGLDLPQLEARPTAPGGATPARPAADSGAPAPAPAPAAPRRVPTRLASNDAGAPKGSPFQAVMLYSRALAEEDRGNRAGAVELYRKSLDVFPGNENARTRLARLEGAR